MWRVGDFRVQGCPNKLLTPEIWKAIEIWFRWKTYGWPFEGGWAEQPARLFDIVDSLERQAKLLESRKIEEAKRGAKH